MDRGPPEVFSISRPRLDRYRRSSSQGLVVESYASEAGGMRSCGTLHRLSINRTAHARYAYRYDGGRFRTIGRPALTLELQPAGRLLEVDGDGSRYVSIFQDPRAFRSAGWDGSVGDLTDAHRLSARADAITLHAALALAALAQDEQAADALTAEHLGNALARSVIRLLGLRSAAMPTAAVLDASGLKRVVDYVDAELARQDLTVKALAKVARTSKSRFSRAFKEACGITPYQFILERRVERARQLLSRGDTPLAQVAYEAGFSSQAHLSTMFRRLAGATPGQFRRSRQL